MFPRIEGRLPSGVVGASRDRFVRLSVTTLLIALGVMGAGLRPAEAGLIPPDRVPFQVKPGRFESPANKFKTDKFRFPGRGTVNPDPAQVLQQLIDLTNAERRKLSLPILKVNPTLTKMAGEHSANMARLNTMADDLDGTTMEQRFEQSGYKASVFDENLAQDRPSAASVIGLWMNFPDTRARILNPKFTEIGVGMAKSSTGMPYFTQVFGTP